MTLLPPNDQAPPDDAAATWLLLHQDGLSADDKALFAQWLTASDANVQAWAHAQNVWEQFDETPDPLLDSIRRSALTLRPPVWQSAKARGMAAAAAVLLCVGFVTLEQAGVRSGHGSARIQVASVEYVAIGDRALVTLADGSKALLDVGSRISVSQSPGRRNVTLLSGQAFFQVAHDKSRPFVVAADGRTVTATGTAFAVSLTSAPLTVVLAEGSVEVASNGGGQKVKMRAGDEFRVDGAGVAGVTRVDVDAALSWREGYVQLENVSIKDVLAEMNRNAVHPVSIGDTAVGALRITGRFKSGDPVRFVETLSEIYPVRLKRLPKGVMQIVSRPGIVGQ